jgi:hypothetical protein
VAARANITPRLADVTSQTRQAKGAIETALSSLLAGRRVNVLGEVNNVLAAH